MEIPSWSLALARAAFDVVNIFTDLIPRFFAWLTEQQYRDRRLKPHRNIRLSISSTSKCGLNDTQR